LDEKQPWITCYLTDILLSHVRNALDKSSQLDYPALFRGLEGFEIPADPESFLTDANHWVPLSVLRELQLQCERLSGRKDFAYHAAKAYFAIGKRQLPSLFDIIVRILNDVRSALIFSNIWGASQTSYLRLQSFEKPRPDGGLYMLSRFDEPAGPSIGAINLLKGFCEGFPRLYPFIDEVRCTEEISQMSLADITREFPGYIASSRSDSIIIQSRASAEAIVEARRVFLQSETITLSPEFTQIFSEAAVLIPEKGEMEVFTRQTEAESINLRSTRTEAYQITRPGVLSEGPLRFALQEGQIYGAPYSRFHWLVKEKPIDHADMSAETMKKEVSTLLFEYLRQAKQAHARILQMTDEKRQLRIENLRLRREIEREYSFAGLVGQSKPMQELFGLIRSIAETDVSVLIQGETGTGKELIARAIHYNSQRKDKKFLAVNCGALASTLLETELFGHEKGAFTGAVSQRKGIFELADGGTLFLDEIGEIPPSTQVKLLRVLQDGELQRVGGTNTIKVNVRIVAATNQNLEGSVQNGGFRQDLYYRLKVFPVMVPPLRERIDDIPALVSHFIEKWSQTAKKSIKEVSSQAMAHLLSYRWPGNVRELENTLQRMIVICKGETLDVQDLPPEIKGTQDESQDKAHDLKSISRKSGGIVEKKPLSKRFPRPAAILHTLPRSWE
jgi:transcriptional regulator with PAS, ATPase and Fis domain